MKSITYPFLFILLFLSVIFSSFAQQNTVLDELLAEEEATFGNSVYLILTASGTIDEDVTPGEAVTHISPEELHIEAKGADAAITLGEFSAILMNAFNIKGGLFYTLFPGPRYATREIAYRKFIQGRISPYMTISGNEAATIVRKAREWKEVYR